MNLYVLNTYPGILVRLYGEMSTPAPYEDQLTPLALLPVEADKFFTFTSIITPNERSRLEREFSPLLESNTETFLEAVRQSYIAEVPSALKARVSDNHVISPTLKGYNKATAVQVTVREAVAKNPKTHPDLLSMLTRDISSTVVRAATRNTSTPLLSFLDVFRSPYRGAGLETLSELSKSDILRKAQPDDFWKFVKSIYGHPPSVMTFVLPRFAFTLTVLDTRIRDTEQFGVLLDLIPSDLIYFTVKMSEHKGVLEYWLNVMSDTSKDELAMTIFSDSVNSGESSENVRLLVRKCSQPVQDLYAFAI